MMLKRDDGTEVDVEYGIEERGSPGNGWDDPGSGTIVYITHAYAPDGRDLADLLTDAERERLELEIGQAVDADDYYDDEY